MSKSRFYVIGGNVYPLTESEPPEVLLQSEKELKKMTHTFPVGTIAYLPNRKKEWQLAPDGVWISTVIWPKPFPSGAV